MSPITRDSGWSGISNSAIPRDRSSSPGWPGNTRGFPAASRIGPRHASRSSPPCTSRSAFLTLSTSLGLGSMKCGLNRGGATYDTSTASPPICFTNSAKVDRVATTRSGAALAPPAITNTAAIERASRAAARTACAKCVVIVRSPLLDRVFVRAERKGPLQEHRVFGLLAGPFHVAVLEAPPGKLALVERQPSAQRLVRVAGGDRVHQPHMIGPRADRPSRREPVVGQDVRAPWVAVEGALFVPRLGEAERLFPVLHVEFALELELGRRRQSVQVRGIHAERVDLPCRIVVFGPGEMREPQLNARCVGELLEGFEVAVDGRPQARRAEQRAVLAHPAFQYTDARLQHGAPRPLERPGQVEAGPLVALDAEISRHDHRLIHGIERDR